jgi:hypothetical protein
MGTIEEQARGFVALLNQIENTEKHIERLTEKQKRYRTGVIRALIGVEIATQEETLSILKALADGKQTPLS